MRREPRAYSHAHSDRAPALMPRVLLQDMFRDATTFNGDISGWDTRSVTDMSVRAIALAATCIAQHISYPQNIWFPLPFESAYRRGKQLWCWVCP